MNIVKRNVPETISKITECITNQTEFALYLVYDKPYVVLGNGIQPNMKYIKDNNITIFEMPSEGGTIVVSQGDVGFGSVMKNDKTNEFLFKARDNLLVLLKSKGLSPIDDSNDILIGGYKVASFSSRRYGEVVFGVFQCSVNVDLELITHICNKPMIKTPKGLSEFGITTEDIVREVVLKTANEID